MDGGEMTLEYYAGDAKVSSCWYLTEDYNGTLIYDCHSSSSTPPLSGWEACKYFGKDVWRDGKAPAPSLSLVSAAQASLQPAQGGIGESGGSVSGCGDERLNGEYVPDAAAKQRAGCSRPFRQTDGGAGTLEFSPAGQWPEVCSGDVWILTERYSGAPRYFCESTASTPPLSGWQVGRRGKAPAPLLSC